MLTNLAVQLTHKQNPPNSTKICQLPTTIALNLEVICGVGGFCLDVVIIVQTLLA
jgi:hypothetical protein